MTSIYTTYRRADGERYVDRNMTSEGLVASFKILDSTRPQPTDETIIEEEWQLVRWRELGADEKCVWCHGDSPRKASCSSCHGSGVKPTVTDPPWTEVEPNTARAYEAEAKKFLAERNKWKEIATQLTHAIKSDEHWCVWDGLCIFCNAVSAYESALALEQGDVK